LVIMFLNHCEQHESVEEYRMGVIEVRRAKKRVAERREKERAEQWAAYYAQQQQGVTEQTSSDSRTAGTKRSAEDASEEQTTKKFKHDIQAEPHTAQSDTQPTVKRDREHNLVIVKNVPADVTEVRVRQFFRDVSLPRFELQL